jgi:predicted kinase
MVGGVAAMRPELLVLCGLPGSGKSHRAKEWVAEDPDGRIRINYDDMRLARFGPDWKFNRKDENQVQEAAKETVITALQAGLSVVIDNTNLSSRVRLTWKDLAIKQGATYINEEIDTPLAECIRRDALRPEGQRVGRAVIERMALFNGFIDFTESDTPIVIVDIDGTVADCEHRIHHIKEALKPHSDICPRRAYPGRCLEVGCPANDAPKKNWAAFHDPKAVAADPVIQPIADLVGCLSDAGYDIIYLTGRDTSLGKVTEEWLGKIDTSASCYEHLFMRQSGDSRKDYEHKLEILEFIPKDRVAFILEDRDQCVKAFRAAGYTCLQVKDGTY